MSRGLLDTSILIAFSEDAGLGAALPEEVAISVATLAELHYGVLLAKSDLVRQQRLRRLGQLESIFQPISIDAAVSRAYATVAHTVKLAGRQPRARTMDLWIAATALVHELPLYTRNAEDFAGLEALLDVRII
jgi:predicted nucleic acid-binding protein